MSAPLSSAVVHGRAVDVVIVSWHHERWLARCLASLAAAVRSPDSLTSITVVDNAASIPGELPDVNGVPVAIVRPGANLGFARGCNVGAARGAGQHVFFLNPDTEAHPGAISEALDAMHGDRVGLVGLRIVDPGGNTQRTCGRFPTVATVLAQSLGVTRLCRGWVRGFRMIEWPHDASRRVDFACGAALLVRRELFEALRGFDERFFLFLEDADLARRALANGAVVRFCHAAVVEHACGWMSGGDRAWRLAHSWRSTALYAHRHFSKRGAWTIAAALTVVAPFSRLVEALVVRSPEMAVDALRAWWLCMRLRRNPANGSAATAGDLRTAEAESPRRG